MPENDYTVAELFTAAGARLRADFEYHRTTALHQGEKGIEVEEILRVFLNAHLPRRFAAAPGAPPRRKQCA
jgi:hypothetical protein